MGRKLRCLGLLIFFMGISTMDAQETLQCDVETYDLLTDLSKSKLSNGKIMLFITTHEDIAWLDEPEICKIDRDEKWLTPYMNKLKTTPDFKMDIEQSSIVMEYLHRHPGERERFLDFIAVGRITIGGAYVQTYEEMYSGESLARQFYLGTKWMRDNLKGYRTRTYYNVDVPGRTIQMPQLASKAGVDNFVFSRHIKGYFNWEAPDGSKVKCYSPGNHYMDFYNLLGMEEEEGIKKMARDAVDWYVLYNNLATDSPVMPIMLNYEFIWDQKPVQNLEPFMRRWNEIGFIAAEGRKKRKVELPKIIFSTADEFFAQVEKTTMPKKTIKGERPNMWVYIHGPSHQKALKASREGDILITQAEKFATVNALLEGTFKNYPEAKLKNAWESKIYPDHGWGGKGGDVTDNVFLQKFLYARAEAKQIVESSLREISGKIQFDPSLGSPVVVFNSLGWDRTDHVGLDIKFDEGEAFGIQISNTLNEVVPHQISKVEHYDDGSIKSAKVQFVAKLVPSLGYDTYYVKSSVADPGTPKSGFEKILENDFYRLQFGNGGLHQIFDKELDRNLIDSQKFMAGEIFAMNSIGNGAGEFSEVQQPDTGFFDRLFDGETQWILEETGPVYSRVVMRQAMKDAVVEMQVKLYHSIKKIDIDVDLLNWNGTMFREFRIAFPFSMDHGKVTYEVPFGAVTIGTDELKGNGGDFYSGEVSKIRPRAIGNWISANGSNFGVTISSSVAAADWIDPTDTLNARPIVQPILLASRKSCHHEGNDYHQTGDHSFSFSLTSHEPGWRKGRHLGVQHNEKIQVVVRPTTFRSATLPEKLSFFGTENENLVISTVKKAEDDNSSIIRIYDADGIGSDARISVFKNIDRAWHTNLIEEPKKELTVKDSIIQLNVGHNAIETIKIK